MSHVNRVSRRELLEGIAAGTALASGLVSCRKEAPARADDQPRTEWDEFRDGFAFTEDKIPLNAANLCPTHKKVAAKVVELTEDIDRDCSFNNREKFEALRENSRRRIAQQLRASPDEIALVRNTSEANNIIGNGLELSPEDEIVIWDQNHPTNNVAWEVRAARFGLQVKRVSLPPKVSSIEEVVDTFRQAIGEKTRVLALTHVSNTTGTRLPIRQISEVAKKRDIHMHVDGAQSWGVLQVNVDELGCDSYSASAHKWFMGPKEAGILYVKKERIPSTWPSVVAPGWGDDVDPDVRGARKFESMGQRDDACLAAMGTTAALHQELGLGKIEARALDLTRRLRDGCRELGFELVTPEKSELSAAICIVAVPEERRKSALNEMYTKHGIACSTSGGLRLAPHVYNTDEHIQRALAGMKAIRSTILS